MVKLILQDSPILCFSDDRLVGLANLHPTTNPAEGRVEIVVDPQVHGAGVGENLLQSIEQQARIRQLKTLVAVTDGIDDAMMRGLAKAGFASQQIESSFARTWTKNLEVNIVSSVHENGTPRRTGVITLNRPKQYNALNNALIDELGAALKAFDADDSVGCIVITGSEKAFAAGADISEMASLTAQQARERGLITRNWETILEIRKPVIAAVAGHALGGGCELAMMCDIIIAADNAKFGQPEVKIGIIPGAGGTQRLPLAIGKSKAMLMNLSGDPIDAVEAERSGLVSRVVPVDQLMPEAHTLATSICAKDPELVKEAKKNINMTFEPALSEGLKFERESFHSLFDTHDQKEGMQAFREKRSPNFTDT
jgi:enoyl-CoA hydratase